MAQYSPPEEHVSASDQNKAQEALIALCLGICVDGPSCFGICINGPCVDAVNPAEQTAFTSQKGARAVGFKRVLQKYSGLDLVVLHFGQGLCL